MRSEPWGAARSASGLRAGIRAPTASGLDVGSPGACSFRKGVLVFRREVLLLILPVVAVSWADTSSPADPDPNRFAQEIRAFKEWDSKNAVPANPILLVGSSSIRLWRTHECLPDLPVINRGFGGSQLSDVTYFAEQIIVPYQPKVIVLYAGDNDIAGGKSAQRVLEDYRRFVGLMHARVPAARIIFIAIKPSGSRWSLWPEMVRTNELIRCFCGQDRHLFFADLATPLLGPDGRPRAELFLDDKLHLNARGYRVWTKALAPVIREVLALPPRDGPER
jgi:lysophospholipase L1-like esterase